MLTFLVTTIHVIVCIVLILVVLLQSGKGADLAGAFGGGGTQTAFGSRGPASFLSKMTTGAAIMFMITSITLSGVGSKTSSDSVLDGTQEAAVPVQAAPKAQEQGATPSPEEIRRIQEEIESKQQEQPPKKTTPPPESSGTEPPATQPPPE